MKIFYPPPPDWETVKTLSFSKRSMTECIFEATKSLDRDCPEFDRYWTDISPVNRDLFIANLVEEIFKDCKPKAAMSDCTK